MNLKIYYLKIDVSCETSVNCQHISQNATPATEFAPCRHLTQPWQCDSQKKNTKHDTCCACHAKWRWTRPKCCACHENCKSSCENVAKVLRNDFRHVTKHVWIILRNDFRHATKHVWMSGSATPATQNGATPHVKPPKVTHFAELTIGTAIRGSRRLLRMVANVCGRLRTVANGCKRLRT